MRALAVLFILFPMLLSAQLQWKNAGTAFDSLPSGIKVFSTDNVLDSAPFRAFYVVAALDNENLHFSTDTTFERRLTPSAYYERNSRPVVVVNGTFFSFQTNRNLNLVMKDGKILSHNPPLKRKSAADSTEIIYYSSAFGIAGNRKADVAWVATDSAGKVVLASQFPVVNGFVNEKGDDGKKNHLQARFDQWKMMTAIGGGPVLIQDGKRKITNNAERKFAGKAIHDKHPRTAIGYTKDNKIIILAVEGRTEKSAGASLIQLAEILLDLGCVEAINLDGGGSSCLLVNGKETITPSDKSGQRPVPAVFMIR